MLVMRLAWVWVVVVVVAAAGCGPGGERECTAKTTDLTSDPRNCGVCGNACGDGNACIGSRCIQGACQPGAVEDCYTGAEGTMGVGPCVGGKRTCGPAGVWSACEGQVVPVAEDCGDGVDNNCNGMVDEDVDLDGDGFTTCGVPGVSPPDCCDSTECSKPALVNGGAFDAPGNGIDDDCNGVIDDTVLLCDQDIPSNTTSGMDFARAIDLCQTAADGDKKWGVIDAKITLADGTGVPDKEAYAVRPRFGGGVIPQGGVNLAIISSGGAAAKVDTDPSYHPWVSYTHAGTQTCNTTPNTQCSSIPDDFLAANGGVLPNAPGCPTPSAARAEDPVMLTFRIRVPTNARSFKLSIDFFSAEFPEWTCSSFNDFFVVLLDSTYDGTPRNPSDKNLAFFQPMGSTEKFPVGVNLAYGNTGLFTQCVNGTTGCSGVPGMITSCVGTEHLAGTGFDDPLAGSCNASSLNGGATGWLVTSGNVKPGEIMTLRIAIWDTSDHLFDSLAVIDGFAWSTEVAQPGTVIYASPAQPLRPTPVTAHAPRR